MSLHKSLKSNIFLKLIILTSLVLINNCSIFSNTKKNDQNQEEIVKKKRIEPNTSERAKAARDKGLVLFGKKVGENGVVSFATSNVLWRASLEVLDFMPLLTVDYAGGIISTDWYKNNLTDKEEIKIRVQFLSNELSASSFKVTSHKKICLESGNCKVVKTKDLLVKKIKNSIISKAREIKLSDEKKNK